MYLTNNTRGRRARFASRFATPLIVCATVLAIVSILTLGLALYAEYIARTLPDMADNLDSLVAERSTIVYARDGSTLVQWHGDEDRTLVTYKEIPADLRNAVVSVEDSRFYQHRGVDIEAIVSAARPARANGRVEKSGSTITQQVVKSLFSTGKRTSWRKIQEAFTANALEARADKAKVLELYLNTVYLGRGYYGVESAAKHYFGKSVSGLTLAEAATIAGIIDSPTKYCPLDHPEAARDRRDAVLDLMAEQGFITPEQLREAVRQAVVLQTDVAPPRAPYFVEYVKQDLIERLGAERVYSGGLRVFTTLDPRLQKLAEKSARTLSRPGDPEVALVAVRHTDGQVLALVGGRDFSVNQFNLAVQGRRQPGSAFKPFVLATALEQGIRPDSKFSATPYSVKIKDGVWNVQNYENEITSGNLTLSAATNWSVNAVYARLIMRVGPEHVVQTAKKMGITTPLDPDPAIALGGLRIGVSPLEMAAAFGTIAHRGVSIAPSGVLHVLDDRGYLVYEPERSGTRALGEAAAAQESAMLRNVVVKGTGVKAQLKRWAAGKTGTTQSYRDAWFVGWSGDVSTAVWVGHRDGQVAMTDVHGIKVTGGSFPAAIWAQFMNGAGGGSAESAESGAEAEPGSRGQVLVHVCRESLDLANGRCPATADTYLDPAKVPEKTCTLH